MNDDKKELNSKPRNVVGRYTERRNFISFDEYYRKYLGLIQEKSEHRIFSTERRAEPVANFYLYHLISTVIDDQMIYSISPKLVQAVEKQISDLSCNSISPILVREIDDIMFKILSPLFYSTNRMHSMTVDNLDLIQRQPNISVLTLSEDLKPLFINQSIHRGAKVSEYYWKLRSKAIQEGRYFVIIENDEIAATSFISDIDFGGGNIVVSTKPKYRRKGYGKAVVARATEWCFENGVRPIYLVAIENAPSVKLAEGLGFKTMSEEIIVSSYIGISL